MNMSRIKFLVRLYIESSISVEMAQAKVDGVKAWLDKILDEFKERKYQQAKNLCKDCDYCKYEKLFDSVYCQNELSEYHLFKVEKNVACSEFKEKEI